MQRLIQAKTFILANVGDVNAQMSLADIFYSNGEYNKAWDYYLLAATQNHNQSQAIHAELKLAQLVFVLKKSPQLAIELSNEAINSDFFEKQWRRTAERDK